MPIRLRLISHILCPYVQRAVIVATEKGISFERVDIDLAAKPDWFLAISPTGKVPVLEVSEADGTVQILFESAVIAEYLDEISEGRLLSESPLERARERAWVEYASATLGDIGRFYSADSEASFAAARSDLERRLAQLEAVVTGAWLGKSFGLADAAFGPVFRYLDVFDKRAGVPLVERSPKIRAWSKSLAARPSVIGAVSPDYEERLVEFVARKGSHLAGLISARALAA